MTAELHLPDLPDVPVTLGPAPGSGREPRRPVPRSVRLREWLSGYLPLLLMMTLALATWWLAKNSPGLLVPRGPEQLRHEPDYTLDHFRLQRFDPAGALKVTIDGEHMQHFPDDDMMEVETIHVVAIDPDGRRLTATARHGRARGDGTEVWLDGQAQVTSEQADQPPVQINGEHLHASPRLRKVDSDSPVVVQQAHSEFTAQGLEYDHGTRMLTLHGQSTALLQPVEARRAR